MRWKLEEWDLKNKLWINYTENHLYNPKKNRNVMSFSQKKYYQNLASSSVMFHNSEEHLQSVIFTQFWILNRNICQVKVEHTKYSQSISSYFPLHFHLFFFCNKLNMYNCCQGDLSTGQKCFDLLHHVFATGANQSFWNLWLPVRHLIFTAV